jgi:aspartate aminotransferase
MIISSRVKTITESVTLKLNARAIELAESGKKIYNLTAGQLPFKPYAGLVEKIKEETENLKSYQYSPVSGFPEVRKKFIANIEKTRKINLQEGFDCVLSNGGKQSIYNALAALVNPGDEVILMAPYWVSYPEMVRLLDGIPIIINSTIFDNFEPSIEDIRRAISERTSTIIINSPSNPSGIHLSERWMNEFGALMVEHPNITIISDEIYFDLHYYDPAPSYFYQKYPALLNRTLICDGISKSLASTGLRLGYMVAPKKICDAASKFQGHTTSGPNSLVQRALMGVNFQEIETYLKPINHHLRENAEVVRDAFRKVELSHLWYQSVSAFYFLVDFSRSPVMKKYKKSENDTEDYAQEICNDLLDKYGIATVPSTDFGLPNAARISLVLEKEPFKKALSELVNFLLG